MTLAEFKAKFEADMILAEDSLKADWTRVLAWIENKQTQDAITVAAEIADLQAKGYTVTPPQATTLV